MLPYVRAKRAVTAGSQAWAGENIPRTASRGLVAAVGAPLDRGDKPPRRRCARSSQKTSWSAAMQLLDHGTFKKCDHVFGSFPPSAFKIRVLC